MEMKWSDRLEDLAEGMFKAWEERPTNDPFAKTCVVVGDLATRDWLKDYFLLKRAKGKRRILANIDFKLLPEFINDWLWLATHGDTGAERKPSEHPYSRDVLTWRIERILASMDVATDEDEVFKPLADYIGTTGADRRRYALAARIATLFDDYLNLRPEMLSKWETSQDDGVAPEYAWQPALYRRLVAKNANTYARDYAKAADASNADANARASRDLGYAEVHLFDCAFVTKAFDGFLKSIGDAIPVTKWDLSFKPTHPSAEMAKSPIPEVPVELHSCYSPRRELETVRNGVYAFLAEHPEVKPSDVRILCADWQNYQPLAGAVFGADWAERQESDEDESVKRTMPVRISGAASELTPLLQSFGDLLAFADNRFEVNAVFGLLGVPAIRAQFDIPPDGVDVLRDMAQAANIHWGYDDDDVDAILGLKHTGPRVYTWRRGLDRLLVDALIGSRANGERLVEVGELKRLLPCGNVEAERARLAASLDAFVRKLAALRRELKKARIAADWCEMLQHAVDDFYQIDGDNALELSMIRRSIREVTHAAELSWSVEGGEGDLPDVGSDIMLSAIVDAISGIHPDDDVHADSMTFSPLTSGAAMAAELIWICGLNDGAFPRGGDRAAFDLLSIDKTDDDFSMRERDVYALRKAAVAARSKLALSYIGRSIKTNEKIPAAVPLSDLVDEIESARRPLVKYEHPLQSYSVRYFYEQRDGTLPASYSAVDRAAAKAIANHRDGEVDGAPETVTPFPFAEQGPTILELEDLVSYVVNSRGYVYRRRLGILDDRNAELVDDERFAGADLNEGERVQIVFDEIDEAGERDLKETLVEQGRSISTEAADSEIEGLHGARDALAELTVDFARGGDNDEFACPGNFVVGEYLAERDMPRKPMQLELIVDGRTVIVRGQRKSERELTNRRGEPVRHELFYVGKSFYPSRLNECWLRHLMAHATGAEFVTGMFIRELTTSGRPRQVRTFRSMPSEMAKERFTAFLSTVMHPLPIPGDDHELADDVSTALDYEGFEFHKGR